MRRIIHNTTAIVACLSILAPQLAQAQLIAPARPVTQSHPAVSDDNIVLAEAGNEDQQIRERQMREGQQQRRRQEEQRKAERAEQRERRQRSQQAEERRGNAERPAQNARQQQAERPERAERERHRERPRQAEERRPRNENAEQPRRERVQNDGERQRNERANRNNNGEGSLQDALRAERRENEQRQRDQRAEEQRQNRQERQAREERRQREERRATEERRDRDDRRQAEERRAEEQRRAERRERDERRRDAERRDEGRRDEGSIARALEAERREREHDRNRNRMEMAGSDEARRRASNMAPLSGVLAGELDNGLRDSDLRCLSGGAPPCRDGGQMITPRGVVVEQNSNGRYQLAPGAQQMYKMSRDGELIPRAAEEDRRQTEAARQAARESRALADALALRDGSDRRGDIFEEYVTRDNYRNSYQDFDDRYYDRWDRDRWRDRDSARRDDDDDGNDLTKALLLGLGALAVGSMLNNNRQVALSSPDRVVLTRPDGSQEIVKDEVALLRQPGSTVETEEFDDGSSRSIVTRADGSKVITIRDRDLRVLRRSVVYPDGRTTRLIDDTREVEPVDIATLPAPATPVLNTGTSMDEAALRDALYRESDVDRRFTLGQIRNIPEVRSLVAPVNIDAITFPSGSAAIEPDQARQLETLGGVIEEAVAKNPQEMFLIEGHTDSVGAEAANLALSDRRAESVALALTEYFDVPPENLVVQGYGEEFPIIRAEGDIRDNRRASVRRITDLLDTAQEQASNSQ